MCERACKSERGSINTPPKTSMARQTAEVEEELMGLEEVVAAGSVRDARGVKWLGKY